VKFNSDFYKKGYFWMGIIGISFITNFPWSNVCSIRGITSLILVVTGIVSIVESMFNFSRYFS